MAGVRAFLANANFLSPLLSDWRASFKWRIASAYGGLILILGLMVAGLVYQAIGRVVKNQIERRADLIGAEVSDLAAGFLSRNQDRELRALVSRYAHLDGVAYLFIEDRNGDVAAHSFKSFPAGLLHPTASSQPRATERAVRRYQGSKVNEARFPILGGRSGSVYLGIWKDSIDAEARRVALPSVGVIAALTLAVLALAILLADRIMHPIRRLNEAAGKLSTGDLETPLGIESEDEVGELARSLERMRASLRTAMWRLGRAR